METTDRTQSIAQQVRDTIQMRPSILDALNMKIVNFSALARILQEEIGEGSSEAVKAAVIRVADEISEDRSLREKAVQSILKDTKVRLQDKIGVVISSIRLDIPHIVTAHLTDQYVYIVDQTIMKNQLPEKVQFQKNLVALILLSPPMVEETPGFVAFITQLLASRNINIVEFISCSTNTIIILHGSQALKAFSLLQNYT
ncbi:ACT domain-containing protein [Candidatus Bathyarchaeota archaeon]|nr:ACT domain-containing protein [Candidatus Bathyarchaeota archaeon]TFH17099.1 MAG: ACT domain-containing protein [Candidatus Bathyarchaeota archaeon]